MNRVSSPRETTNAINNTTHTNILIVNIERLDDLRVVGTTMRTLGMMEPHRIHLMI